MREIRLHDTLSGKVIPLSPRDPGRVGIYACGPTVYSRIHVGNARPFVVFSLLRRFLEHEGYEVSLVINVTDVNDKIYDAARAQDRPSAELAAEMTAFYQADTDLLGLGRPDQEPLASETIGPILDYIQALIDRDHAYAVEGDVYFRVRSDQGYGSLSHRLLENLDQGEGIDGAERKQDPLDFALWKAHKPGEDTFWPAPWGEGRPGWHIECSAMALNILGAGFDIHGGARELMFPHHENEVAQSECFLEGGVFAKLWWHCGVVQVEGKKMSKSLGNFLTVRAALELAPSNVWRLLYLMTHPRSPLDYSEERLQQTRNAWSRLHAALSEAVSAPAGAGSSREAREFQERFEAALADDLNTPVALAAVFEGVTEWHRTHLDDLAAAVRHAMETLGFEFAPAGLSNGTDELTPQLLQLLIEVRDVARERRDFPGADLIRNRLKDLGVLLEDTVDGTRWKKAM